MASTSKSTTKPTAVKTKASTAKKTVRAAKSSPKSPAKPRRKPSEPNTTVGLFPLYFTMLLDQVGLAAEMVDHWGEEIAGAVIDLAAVLFQNPKYMVNPGFTLWANQNLSLGRKAHHENFYPELTEAFERDFLYTGRAGRLHLVAKHESIVESFVRMNQRCLTRYVSKNQAHIVADLTWYCPHPEYRVHTNLEKGIAREFSVYDLSTGLLLSQDSMGHDSCHYYNWFYLSKRLQRVGLSNQPQDITVCAAPGAASQDDFNQLYKVGFDFVVHQDMSQEYAQLLSSLEKVGREAADCAGLPLKQSAFVDLANSAKLIPQPTVSAQATAYEPSLGAAFNANSASSLSAFSGQPSLAPANLGSLIVPIACFDSKRTAAKQIDNGFLNIYRLETLDSNLINPVALTAKASNLNLDRVTDNEESLNRYIEWLYDEIDNEKERLGEFWAEICQPERKYEYFYLVAREKEAAKLAKTATKSEDDSISASVDATDQDQTSPTQKQPLSDFDEYYAYLEQIDRERYALPRMASDELTVQFLYDQSHQKDARSLQLAWHEARLQQHRYNRGLEADAPLRYDLRPQKVTNPNHLQKLFPAFTIDHLRQMSLAQAIAYNVVEHYERVQAVTDWTQAAYLELVEDASASYLRYKVSSGDDYYDYYDDEEITEPQVEPEWIERTFCFGLDRNYFISQASSQAAYPLISRLRKPIGSQQGNLIFLENDVPFECQVEAKQYDRLMDRQFKYGEDQALYSSEYYDQNPPPIFHPTQAQQDSAEETSTSKSTQTQASLAQEQAKAAAAQDVATLSNACFQENQLRARQALITYAGRMMVNTTEYDIHDPDFVTKHFKAGAHYSIYFLATKIARLARHLVNQRFIKYLYISDRNHQRGLEPARALALKASGRGFDADLLVEILSRHKAMVNYVYGKFKLVPRKSDPEFELLLEILRMPEVTDHILAAYLETFWKPKLTKQQLHEFVTGSAPTSNTKSAQKQQSSRGLEGQESDGFEGSARVGAVEKQEVIAAHGSDDAAEIDDDDIAAKYPEELWDYYDELMYGGLIVPRNDPDHFEDFDDDRDADINFDYDIPLEDDEFFDDVYDKDILDLPGRDAYVELTKPRKHPFKHLQAQTVQTADLGVVDIKKLVACFQVSELNSLVPSYRYLEHIDKLKYQPQPSKVATLRPELWRRKLEEWKAEWDALFPF